MRKWDNWTPMGVLAVAVAIGITGIIIALIISVVQGGPPDTLSEGTFAVLSAAIGAVAGYSVADRKGTDAGSLEVIDLITDEDDDEVVPIVPIPLDDDLDDDFDDLDDDDDGDEFVMDDAQSGPGQHWIEDALITEESLKKGDDREA